MIVDVKRFDLYNLDVYIDAVFEESGQKKLYKTHFVCKNTEQYDTISHLDYCKESFEFIESLKLDWILSDTNYTE